MKYKAIYLVFILFSCSHSNKELEEIAYYPETDIVWSKKIFKSLEDKEKGTFKILEFDNIGNIIYSFKYKDSILDGEFTEYYPNGVLKYITNYNKGLENGIAKHYNEDGFLITEGLVCDGYQFVNKHFTVFHKSKTKGYSIFLIKNDTIVNTEGEIMYDSLMNNIIDSSTYYYDVKKIKRTQDDGFKLKVSLLGTAYQNYKTNINLVLGELNIEDFSNNMYSLKDTIKIIESGKNELEFSCNQINIEDDLLTGLLQLELFSLDGSEKIDDIYFTFYYDLSAE